MFLPILLFFIPYLLFQSELDTGEIKQESWSIELDGLGTFSSPRMADLDQDGVLDIIMGAGRKEFNSCDTAVFALSGKDGKMIWNVGARDQIFGSPALMDINSDNIPDVFIGGRSAELMAINGRNGEIIWEFFPEGDLIPAKDSGWYNFYNPQFIPDQNEDGIKEILISNGGDVLAEPYDPNRAAGSLLIINPLNGSALAQATMPDNKEIYMSVVAHDFFGNGDIEIIFGTGGETIGGNLFRVALGSVLNGDITDASLLATGDSKGFIAPPVLVDLNHDDIKDIVVNSVDGRIMAFNGKSNELLWGGKIPETEVYSSLAVGDLNNDQTPDLFAVFANGIWPNLSGTRPLAINGNSGQIMLLDSIGFYQTSSPVIGDFNNDSFNDALISVNFFISQGEQNPIIHNSLLVYDFKRGGKYALSKPLVGSNVASTPWVGDIDGDQFIDIIYCQMTKPDEVYTYDGIRINRLATDIPLNQKISWGAYMGNDYNGIFNEQPD